MRGLEPRGSHLISTENGGDTEGAVPGRLQKHDKKFRLAVVFLRYYAVCDITLGKKNFYKKFNCVTIGYECGFRIVL